MALLASAYLSSHARKASGPPALMQAAGRHVAGAADRMAVTAIRLALLGAVVWCGTSIVTHVTTTLQDIARPAAAQTVTAAR